jgi:hypothetical protein
MRSNGLGDGPLAFEEMYGPYAQKRKALLDALSKFARRFQ